MGGHKTCKYFLATCIDFRFQKSINEHFAEKFSDGQHDRLAIAGGCKDLDYLLSQLALSVKLHEISEVHLVNHEDCGAYGNATFEDHKKDLLRASEAINKKYPKLAVFCYYLNLEKELVAVASDEPKG